MLRFADKRYCDLPESAIAEAEAHGYEVGCIVGELHEMPDAHKVLPTPYFHVLSQRRTYQQINGTWRALDGARPRSQ
jgi:hypothetical protein